MRRETTLLFVLATAGLALCACTDRSRSAPGIGRRLASGKAFGLRPSPDGRRLAWLERCSSPPPGQGAPTCDLVVAETRGGASAHVAKGVSSLEAGFAWGADGALAALAEYDAAAGTGTLVLLRPGGAPRPVAPQVSFYGFGPGGALGFVSAGRIHVAAPGGEPVPVVGGENAATFEFNPSDPSQLLARRQAAAGGELLRMSAGVAHRQSQAPAGDYAWSPDGRYVAATVRGVEGTWDLRLWPPAPAPSVALAKDVQAFSFSPDGAALAFLAGMAPGKAGDLFVVRLPGAGGVPRAEAVAKGVGEFRWAAGATRLAWLQSFDPRVRAGTLGVGGPGAPTSTFGKNVTAFELSPSAAQVAFLEHVTAGGYSVDLVLSPAEGGAPVTVARGAFGFEFSHDGRWLYYRTNCVRNGEGCDLLRIPAGGLAPGQRAERLAESVKSFEFDRSRPDRLLLGFARKDILALDLAVWQGSRMVPVDKAVFPGSARFLPPDGSRLAYAVVGAERAGVYVADLP